MKIYEKYQLTDRDLNRIIEMAWEDRTPFDAIEEQFGLSEAEVIKVMRREMRPRNWRKWRARVQGRATKHRYKRQAGTKRFRSTAQRDISQNRISKPR
ncbi:MAG: TIGR03643 family protein [Bacteroidetes bacterium]|nr:MAG: TIGR03643 family protein [Bacteroidota bacterium]